MKLSEFDFDLPERLIATRPARPRSSARLLVAEGDAIRDAHVSDLPGILRPGDRLVLNDTRVIPARLTGVRRRAGAEGEGAARIEATLLEPLAGGDWRALLKPLRKVRDGEEIVFSPRLSAVVAGREEGTARLSFNLGAAISTRRWPRRGRCRCRPTSPSGARPTRRTARTTRPSGRGGTGRWRRPRPRSTSTRRSLRRSAERGVGFTHVTLHVGAGTFLPVKVDDVTRHKMHAEWGEITPEAAREIAAARAAGGRIIPVGTTAMRLLESAARADGTVRPWVGETDIFITPGFAFRACDALMTNFHLPKSTLMMLVSAFMGTGRIRAIYAHAVAAEYRFFSYGDASLLIPE
jgi:S-adenosylmethionine:tRNA ribosyltransferase-isomerase